MAQSGVPEASVARKQSQYIGVSWFEQTGKWQARISVDTKVRSLGYYHNEDDAARAYDAEALSTRGPNAVTNFPASSYQRDNHQSFKAHSPPSSGTSDHTQQANTPRDGSVSTQSEASGRPTAFLNRPGSAHRTTTSGAQHTASFQAGPSTGTSGDPSAPPAPFSRPQSATSAVPVSAAITLELNPPAPRKRRPGLQQLLALEASRQCVRHSQYIGVTWDKHTLRWKAQVWTGNTNKTMGYYDDEVEAAAAYDRGAAVLKGAQAKLNFASQAALLAAQSKQQEQVQQEHGAALGTDRPAKQQASPVRQEQRAGEARAEQHAGPLSAQPAVSGPLLPSRCPPAAVKPEAAADTTMSDEEAAAALITLEGGAGRGRGPGPAAWRGPRQQQQPRQQAQQVELRWRARGVRSQLRRVSLPAVRLAAIAQDLVEWQGAAAAGRTISALALQQQVQYAVPGQPRAQQQQQQQQQPVSPNPGHYSSDYSGQAGYSQQRPASQPYSAPATYTAPSAAQEARYSHTGQQLQASPPSAAPSSRAHPGPHGGHSGSGYGMTHGGHSGSGSGMPQAPAQGLQPPGCQQQRQRRSHPGAQPGAPQHAGQHAAHSTKQAGGYSRPATHPGEGYAPHGASSRAQHATTAQPGIGPSRPAVLDLNGPPAPAPQQWASTYGQSPSSSAPAGANQPHASVQHGASYPSAPAVYGAAPGYPPESWACRQPSYGSYYAAAGYGPSYQAHSMEGAMPGAHQQYQGYSSEAGYTAGSGAAYPQGPAGPGMSAAGGYHRPEGYGCAGQHGWQAYSGSWEQGHGGWQDACQQQPPGPHHDVKAVQQHQHQGQGQGQQRAKPAAGQQSSPAAATAAAALPGGPQRSAAQAQAWDSCERPAKRAALAPVDEEAVDQAALVAQLTAALAAGAAQAAGDGGDPSARRRRTKKHEGAVPDGRRINMQSVSGRGPGNGRPKSSQYIGVTWHKNGTKWQAQIRLQGTIRSLGYYNTEEDAARAFDAAARQYRGPGARVNFGEQGEVQGPQGEGPAGPQQVVLAPAMAAALQALASRGVQAQPVGA
jgi:hypothetical protein